MKQRFRCNIHYDVEDLKYSMIVEAGTCNGYPTYVKILFGALTFLKIPNKKHVIIDTNDILITVDSITHYILEKEIKLRRWIKADNLQGVIRLHYDYTLVSTALDWLELNETKI